MSAQKTAFILGRGNEGTIQNIENGLYKANYKTEVILHDRKAIGVARLCKSKNILEISNRFIDINKYPSFFQPLSSSECDLLVNNLESFIGHFEREVEMRHSYLLRTPYSTLLNIGSFCRGLLTAYDPHLIYYQNTPFRTLQFVLSLLATHEGRRVAGISNIHYPKTGYTLTECTLRGSNIFFKPIKFDQKNVPSAKFALDKNKKFTELVPKYFRTNSGPILTSWAYKVSAESRLFKNKRKQLSALLKLAYDLFYLIGLEKMNRIISGIYYNLNSLHPNDVPKDSYWIAMLNRVPEKSTYPDSHEYGDTCRFVYKIVEECPKGTQLIIKEHPNQFSLAHKSKNSYSRSLAIYDYLMAIPQVQLCPSSVSQEMLIKNAERVIVTTGTSALQALQMGKNANIYGNPVYSYYINKDRVGNRAEFTKERSQEIMSLEHTHIITKMSEEIVYQLASSAINK